jgi:carboxyl-terminal processing protease
VNHNKRISHDKGFQYLLEDIAEFNRLRKKNLISLNEDERRKEREAQEARDKLREKNRGNNGSNKTAVPAKSHALQDDGMLPSERNLSADLAIEAANKNTKDILLDEAAHIVSDDVGLLQAHPKLADRK